VLNAPAELLAQVDLEEDTINQVKDVLMAEFED
jgi:hypothetical protein